jgi:bifunctional NMN adenylyltransferase/nudix hydrolase
VAILPARAARRDLLHAQRGHPDRSLRGRTITHVHYLDLGVLPALPPVQGGDDAALARWVAVGDLPGMESAFFEDHFQILRQFLPLAEQQPQPDTDAKIG